MRTRFDDRRTRIALARAVVNSGKALAWLQRLRAFAQHSGDAKAASSGSP
jgi:hypothetical protein